MADITGEFEKINIKIYDCKSGKRYFDPVRKMFLCMTPEELVRQKMIVYLQTQLGVALSNMFVEDHLIHYGVEDINGRIDISILENGEKPLCVVECKEPKIPIEGTSVYMQAAGYAAAIHARYIILVNGLRIQFFKEMDGAYEAVEDILSYEDMMEGKGKAVEAEQFKRLSMENYSDLDFLRNQEWFSSKVGEDTSEKLIPAIINLDDCFWDYSHKLEGNLTDDFEILADLGINFMNYGDASGGGFGTGYYRSFLVNEIEKNKQFITGFTLMATAKTAGDKKYGNRDGLTVLIVSRNDGDYDETSVQINLNKFLNVNNGKAIFTHNAAVTRKGATKQAVMDYVERKAPGLVKNGEIYLGAVDIAKPLYADNDDVKHLLGSLIMYSVYRDEYKHQL